MNFNKKNFMLVFSLFFFFLFSFNFLSAVPPVTTIQQFPQGYSVVDARQDYLKQNENYTHHWIVYNSSNGIKITNETINCSMFMSDSSGSLLLSNKADYNSVGFFYLTIGGGNFSKTGIYTYSIDCMDDSGGSLAGAFEVTPSGQSGIENIVFFILIILLIYGITFFGFFGKNIPLTILGGMAMLFLGVYLINNGIISYRNDLTNYIAYVTIGVGAIASMWAILEQLDVL